MHIKKVFSKKFVNYLLIKNIFIYICINIKINNMKLQLETEIKNWYLSEYPTDEEGINLKAGITFLDLFKHLDNKDENKDTYNFIFNDYADSLIRERLFSALAEIFKTDYNYIYNKWLHK